MRRLLAISIQRVKQTKEGMAMNDAGVRFWYLGNMLSGREE